jgi:hypothetical protein
MATLTITMSLGDHSDPRKGGMHHPVPRPGRLRIRHRLPLQPGKNKGLARRPNGIIANKQRKAKELEKVSKK